ncbi:MAG: hypothetical protein WA113_07180, partial [Desulfitobacteriaceae bacterium]
LTIDYFQTLKIFLRQPEYGTKQGNEQVFVFFIATFYLPVYASQYLLPYTTQDSVLDCWLGFVKAVISNRMCYLSLARRNRHNS